MADEKLLAILKQGVGAWNEWRARNRDAALNLRKASLKLANLSEADLTGAKLTGANLSGANLSGTNLSGANLSGARLVHAHLAETDLGEANLSGAKLIGASLANLNLATANGLEKINHLGPSIIDHLTLERSGQLPPVFLRGCGLPDLLIDFLPSLLNTSIQFFSCFISYSNKDKSFAKRLHDQLQGQGIRCWRDEHQLLPGDDIGDMVDQGVKLWDKVLLCCSEQSLNSYWVNKEIDKALRKEEELWKRNDKRVEAIIPLSLDGYLLQWGGSRASELTRRLAADFKGSETDNALFEAQLEKVVKALRADQGAREKPPPPKI